MTHTRIEFTGPRQVAVRDVPEGLEPGPGEVLLRTRFSMVSAGTELAKLTGLQGVAYPYVPGNRAVGEIAAVGPDVTRHRPGQLVFAHTPHASMAKTAGFCAPVPDRVPPEHAAAIGLGLVAMTALRVARPELGDRVVVFGAGPVGNLCAQLFACSGAEVTVVDALPGRLEIARRCGLPRGVDAGGGSIPQAVLARTGPEGAEIVVEATGNPAAIEPACAVARREGRVILLGSPRGEFPGDLTALLNRVHLWREHGCLTLEGAHEWRYPTYADGFSRHSMERNARILFRLLGDGRLRVEPLITHVVPAAEAPAAYAGLLAQPEQWAGVLFDWRGDDG